MEIPFKGENLIQPSIYRSSAAFWSAVPSGLYQSQWILHPEAGHFQSRRLSKLLAAKQVINCLPIFLFICHYIYFRDARRALRAASKPFSGCSHLFASATVVHPSTAHPQQILWSFKLASNLLKHLGCTIYIQYVAKNSQQRLYVSPIEDRSSNVAPAQEIGPTFTSPPHDVAVTVEDSPTMSGNSDVPHYSTSIWFLTVKTMKQTAWFARKTHLSVLWCVNWFLFTILPSSCLPPLLLWLLEHSSSSSGRLLPSGWCWWGLFGSCHDVRFGYADARHVQLCPASGRRPVQGLALSICSLFNSSFPNNQLIHRFPSNQILSGLFSDPVAYDCAFEFHFSPHVRLPFVPRLFINS